MGTILLFHVNIMKTGEIANVCRALGHSIISVPKKDYDKSLGVLVKANGMQGEALYTGEDFQEEMMVFSGLDSKAMDAFLAAYRLSNIAPIPRKASITATNQNWSARKLYAELEEHMIHG